MLSVFGFDMLCVGLRLTEATTPLSVSMKLVSLSLVSMGASAIAEGRLALLDKGGHAFLLVLGRKGRMEQPALEAHPFGEGRLEGAVDRFLDHYRDRY